MRYIPLFVSIAIFLIATVIGLEVIHNYDVAFPYGVEKNIGSWGTLGDFFGGILNPIFAFLALLSLLVTIVIQSMELSASREEMRKTAEALRDQYNHMQMQAEKEDLFRMITHVNKSLSELMHVKMRFPMRRMLPGDNAAILSINDLFGLHRNPELTQNMPRKGTDAFDAFSAKLDPALNLLDELKKYLSLYESLSNGDKTITGFYIRRYRDTIFDMQSMGFAGDNLFHFYTNDWEEF